VTKVLMNYRGGENGNATYLACEKGES